MHKLLATSMARGDMSDITKLMFSLYRNIVSSYTLEGQLIMYSSNSILSLDESGSIEFTFKKKQCFNRNDDCTKSMAKE